MNLTNPYHTQLSGVPFLNSFIDHVLTAINTIWAVEHKLDGTHGVVTATSVTVEETVIADGAGTFGGLVTAQSGTAPVVIGTIPGIGTGIDLTHVTATARWQIYTDSASPAGALRFRDMSDTSTVPPPAWHFLIAETSTGIWDLLPNTGVSLRLGLNLTGSRMAAVHATDMSSLNGYVERGRAVAAGEWQNEAFNAANFTGNGAMTWTLASGDQVTYRYMLLGKTIVIDYVFSTTTVGGTPSTQLRVAVPTGFTFASATHLTKVGVAVDATNVSDAIVQVIDATHWGFLRVDGAAWTASVNQTELRGQFLASVA